MSQALVCDQCDSEIEDFYRFCGECGANIEKVDPSPPPAPAASLGSRLTFTEIMRMNETINPEIESAHFSNTSSKSAANGRFKKIAGLSLNLFYVFTLLLTTSAAIQLAQYGGHSEVPVTLALLSSIALIMLTAFHYKNHSKFFWISIIFSIPLTIRSVSFYSDFQNWKSYQSSFMQGEVMLDTLLLGYCIFLSAAVPIIISLKPLIKGPEWR